MNTRNESEAKTHGEPASDETRRAANPFIRGLDEWIEWRAEKLQGVRQEIAEKTRLTRKPDMPGRARAVTRG